MCGKCILCTQQMRREERGEGRGERGGERRGEERGEGRREERGESAWRKIWTQRFRRSAANLWFVSRRLSTQRTIRHAAIVGTARYRGVCNSSWCTCVHWADFKWAAWRIFKAVHRWSCSSLRSSMCQLLGWIFFLNRSPTIWRSALLSFLLFLLNWRVEKMQIPRAVEYSKCQICRPAHAKRGAVGNNCD